MLVYADQRMILEECVPVHGFYRNREIAEYTRSKAMIVLTTLMFFTRNLWNTEPNNPQQQFETNAVKASSTAKPVITGADL